MSETNKILDYEGLAIYTEDAKKYIQDQIKNIPQHDWNQEDETASDYIKNKPFYINKDGNVITMDEKFIPDTIVRKSDLEDINLSGYATKESVNELSNNVNNLPRMEVSETAPVSENVNLWVKSVEGEECIIPEVKDDEVSEVDTWSSNKINEEISKLSNEIDDIFKNTLLPVDINKCIVLDNVYINTTSSIANSSGVSKSLYFECTPNTRYTIKNLGSSSSKKVLRVGFTKGIPAFGIPLYDFINADGMETVTISSNTEYRYLVICYYIESTDSSVEPDVIYNGLVIMTNISKSLTKSVYGLNNVKLYGAVGDGVTDDTNAFNYAFEHNDTVYVPNGKYLIKPQAWLLNRKSIVGESKRGAVIIAHESGVTPIAIIGEFGKIENVMFSVTRKTNTYCPIVFGSYNDSFCTFTNHLINNVHILGNEHTVAFYFHLMSEGCVGGNITNTSIENCKNGILFELDASKNEPWVTNQNIENVFIKNPYAYGFRIVSNQIGRGQISHSSFKNISVEILTPNAVGFALSNGGYSLFNPTVFNDNTEGIGYSIDYGADRRKQFEYISIFGGFLEGKEINPKLRNRVGLVNTVIHKRDNANANDNAINEIVNNSITPSSKHNTIDGNVIVISDAIDGIMTLNGSGRVIVSGKNMYSGKLYAENKGIGSKGNLYEAGGSVVSAPIYVGKNDIVVSVHPDLVHENNTALIQIGLYRNAPTLEEGFIERVGLEVKNRSYKISATKEADYIMISYYTSEIKSEQVMVEVNANRTEFEEHYGVDAYLQNGSPYPIAPSFSGVTVIQCETSPVTVDYVQAN